MRSRVRDPGGFPLAGADATVRSGEGARGRASVVSLLVVVLAAVFSSPDEAGVTIQRWARANPSDFVVTATTELDGTSASASYGPPYNSNGPGQKIGPVGLQKLAGVRIPIDSPHDFVIAPLQTVTGDQALTAALARFTAASIPEQQRWASQYDQAIQKAPGQDPAKVSAGDYGPVPIMTARLLQLAQSGALDSQLVNPGTGFYQTDYTRPLLFLADGAYLADLAAARHLSGNQWGMTNETGNSPRPGVALALHVLVPGVALLALGQRRRPDLGDHGSAIARARPRAVHPGCAVDPEGPADLSRHLARRLPTDRQLAARLNAEPVADAHAERHVPQRSLGSARDTPRMPISRGDS